MPDLNNTTPDPYQFLERISTQELKRLLREDLGSESESNSANDEFITKVMEVIAQRETEDTASSVFDVAAGWESFQKNYRPTEDDPILLCDDEALKELSHENRVVKTVHQAFVSKSSVVRRQTRRIALIAATIGIFMALLIGAQAAGVDVFGNLARWTDEVFFFVPSAWVEGQQSEYSAILSQGLEAQGLPKELAPAWFPDGFQPDEPQVWHNDTIESVDVLFRHEDGRSFAVSVNRYPDSDDIQLLRIEKDAAPVELYPSNGRMFYIMSNLNTIESAWNENNLMMHIGGTISADEVKQIIDSIGG